MNTTPADDDAMAGLRVAADAGDMLTAQRLAGILIGQRRFAEAFPLHKLAAIEGHVPAQIDLALMLLHGIGCVADPHTAVYWLRRAEATGSSEASYHLAFIALGGVAMPRDGRINERVLSAVQGEHPPALRAAAIHFGRKHNEADQISCVRLLDRAASHGDIVAAQLLAERLARGEGCPPQPSAARRLRRQLASMGIAPLPAIDVAATDAAHHEGQTAPPGTIALEDTLHPAPMLTLSAQPRILQIDGLLSVDECRLLMAYARQDADPPSFAIDADHEDLSLRLVQLRLARSARVELAQAEPLRISRGGVGDHAATSDTPGMARAGERIRSIHVLLNAPTDGRLAWTADVPAVAAIPGRAVIVDVDAAAAGSDITPVVHEAQWLASLHFRHRRCRDF